MENKYNDNIDYWPELLNCVGFSIERSDTGSTSVTGIHSPSIFRLKYQGKNIKTIVHKDFNSAEPEKLNRELLLTKALHWYGIDVPQIRDLGSAYNSGAVYSVFEPDLTAEEAMKKHISFDEKDVIGSLVDFNVQGAFFFASYVKEYLDRWEKRDPRIWTQKRRGEIDMTEISKLENTKDLVAILEDLTSEEERAIDPKEVKHLSSNPNKNYKAEFKRRMHRLGIKDRFIDQFTQRYIEPMMGNRILSHNDFHIGNVFTRGKIIDPESACYGALGDDLARYLISQYTYCNRLHAFEETTVQDIIDKNSELIEYFVGQYNSAINEVDETYGRVGDVLGLKEVEYDEFVKGFEGMLIHSALSRVSQRIYDYEKTDDKDYLYLAHKNFRIFYSSLDEKEKKLFDRDVKDSSCPTLRVFVKHYNKDGKAA